MDSGELLTALRTTAFLPTADPVFDDARLRVELTDAQHTVVERAVLNSRGGYWLKRDVRTTDGTTTRYRIPYRALGGVLRDVKLGTSVAAAKSTTKRYQMFGDVLEFEQAPDANLTLVFEYYLRPSRFVEPQTDGRVTAIDNTSADPNVTLNAIPDRMLGSGAPAVISSLSRADIVKPNGWHEVCLVNEIIIIIGSTIHFTPGTDLSDVEVGDFVRAADESEWPALPDDFHRMLADIAASNVLLSKKNTEGAGAIMQKVGPVAERFLDIITPRVKAQPPAVIPTVGILRRRSRNYGDLPR